MHRIDLHGYHLHEAWKQFKTKVDDAYYAGHLRVEVVTGQGRIMNEMPGWITNHTKIREYIQKRWNPGSFTCILNKRPK